MTLGQKEQVEHTDDLLLKKSQEETMWPRKVAGHLDVNCLGNGELDFFFFSWALKRSKGGSEKIIPKIP